MKNIIQQLIIVILFSAFTTSAANLISDGDIHGRIKDKQSGKPMEFVSVVALINEHVVTSTSTDENGYFTLKPLKAGVYNVKAVMINYIASQINDITVNSESSTTVNIELKPTEESLPVTEVFTYKNPIFDPGEISTIQIIETEQIKNSPATTVNDLVALTAGVIQKEEDGELNVRGSRSDATQYVIDGVKANGPFRIPKSAIKEITVLTGGIPAMFGDATGGIIIITTKGYIGW